MKDRGLSLKEFATPVDTSRQADDSDWSSLLAANSLTEGVGPWLRIAMSRLHDLEAAMVFSPDLAQVLAQAPDPTDGAVSAALRETADLARREGRGVLSEDEEGGRIGYPVRIGDERVCIVSVAFASGQEDAVARIMRHLQWSTAWLRSLWLNEIRGDVQGRETRALQSLRLLSDVLSLETMKSAALAVVSRLVRELDLERACLGFLRRGHIRVEAISDTATFGHQMSLVRQTALAMDEAIDQRAAILFPGSGEDMPTLTSAHEALHQTHRTGQLLTVPLFVRDQPVGALTCEAGRGRSFTQRDVDVISALAAYAAPLLMEKGLNDRHIVVKIAVAVWRQVQRLLGRGNAGRKFAVLALIGVVAFFYAATATYTINAGATVEGRIQRAISAPYDGFILESAVSAGDRVEAGQVLARLDDRDLALERDNWLSRKKEQQANYDRALGERNRADIKIYAAMIEQADIQLGLIDEKLERVNITAPFDGLVVSGDLSQSIGGAVRRGEVLFEIAPVDDYRLTLAVSETQIADVKAGQGGDFLATSMPDQPHDFEVARVTPVALVEEGRTVFEVEATLSGDAGLLRPGMNGVAKIEAGEARLIWIWSRELLHWLRLQAWAYFP